MKIEPSMPPGHLWDEIIAAGMHPKKETAIITYGDTIYVPSGASLPDHLVEHEGTHSEQQGSQPDEWWGRYLTDPYFRVDQEAEAYANQFSYFCARMKDRNIRAKFLYILAGHLSGKLYGEVIDRMAATKMIKERSGVSL